MAGPGLTAASTSTIAQVLPASTGLPASIVLAAFTVNAPTGRPVSSSIRRHAIDRQFHDFENLLICLAMSIGEVRAYGMARWGRLSKDRRKYPNT